MKITNKLAITIALATVAVLALLFLFSPFSAGAFTYDFYVKNYRTYCYSNNIYWFDSMDNAQDIYQNCSDDNQCTIDTCGDNKCKNILKCDGSTCSVDSPDYLKSCGIPLVGGQMAASPSPSQTSNEIQVPLKNEDLIVSILGKKESDGGDFQESVNVASGDKLSFSAEIENKSDSSAKDILLKIDFGEGITYDGGLEIDGIESAGDLISGLNLGTLPSKIKKKITFSVSVKSDFAQKELKVIANVNSGEIQKSDFLAILTTGEFSQKSNFIASLSAAPAVNFIKERWFWFIGGAILLFLFFVIFKKLSLET